MDRMLLVKGETLIEAWENLTPAHITNWLKAFFPVAFKENEHGQFGAYPTDVYCEGSIIQLEPKLIPQVLDPEYTYTLGWDAAIDRKTLVNTSLSDLYFNVIWANVYLREKGFRLNDHKEKNWINRVSDAKQAALDLDKVYNNESVFKIDSEEFRIWYQYVSDIDARATIRLSLKILLKSLCGMSNAELKAEFSRASISRYISDAKRFITKNSWLFNDLPNLPL